MAGPGPFPALAAAAAVAATLALAAPAAAQLYRWTDEQGNVHYTQGLYSIPERHRGSARLVAPPEPPAAPPAPAPAAPAPGTPGAATPAPGAAAPGQPGATPPAPGAPAPRGEAAASPQLIQQLDEELRRAVTAGDILAVGQRFLANGARDKAREAAARAAEVARTRDEWFAVAGLYRHLGFREEAEAAMSRAAETRP
jgi:hypothetical protein